MLILKNYKTENLRRMKQVPRLGVSGLQCLVLLCLLASMDSLLATQEAERDMGGGDGELQPNDPSPDVLGNLIPEFDIRSINDPSPRRQLRERQVRRRQASKRVQSKRLRLRAKGEGSQNNIIRNLVGHLFGFKASTSPTAVPLTHAYGDTNNANRRNMSRMTDGSNGNVEAREGDNTLPHPPNFMLELYRTLSENRSQNTTHSTMRGNTVRSFFSTSASSLNRKDKIGRATPMIPITSTKMRRGGIPIPVFVYNLTSVPHSEELFAAEIRQEVSADGLANDEYHEQDEADTPKRIAIAVYKRQRGCPEEIDCIDADAQAFYKVGETLLIHASSTTTWSDTRLTKLANKARKPGYVLILKFQLMDGGEEQTSNYLDEDLPTIFETVPNGGSVREDIRNTSMVDNVGSGELMPILVAYCNDLPKISKYEAAAAATADILGAVQNIPMKKRKKVRRSVHVDGQPAPSDAHGQSTENSEEKRRFFKRTSETNIVHKWKEPEGTAENPSNDTETSENTGRPRRKNSKCGKKGRRRNGRCKKMKKDKQAIKRHPSLNSERDTEGCKRESLHVDFADIGWSDWIISPLFFETYYCTGRCHLPKMQDSGYTNHAIIQAAMRSTKAGKNVPAPCCVPDKLMSLGVLFFDEDRNVVLKRFPDMSVETCACR